jgi:predicted SAM-dependent methyltransferase
MKLDIGCGTRKQEGHIGVDIIDFPGVDVVMNAGQEHWPWENDSVEEIWCSHFVEHLTAKERIHFVNEAYRVLKDGGKVTIVVPSWSSNRAYGDLTHQWPPVSEMWFFYLNKDWRKDNAPHNNFYECDFDATWAYGMHQSLLNRNQETQQMWLTFFKEAAQDIVGTLIKKPKS